MRAGRPLSDAAAAMSAAVRSADKPPAQPTPWSNDLCTLDRSPSS